MKPPSTITWVNHASFIYQSGDIRLMTDPWLFGDAFNKGWDLIADTKFQLEDFKDITHIWFSHEHPDHFSPRVISAIPEELRSNITVLFQESFDQKVINFCKSRGFKVQELPLFERVYLRDDFYVVCGPEGMLDSYLYINDAGYGVLNLNDCRVVSRGISARLQKNIEAVDVLLTQFSYANWAGNPDEKHLREAAAEDKWQSICAQLEVFKPRYLIPFASFVFFSHEENSFCNDSILTVHEVTQRLQELESEHQFETIVLYPEDVWHDRADYDNTHALARYQADYDAISSRPLHTVTSVDLETLTTGAESFIKRVNSKHQNIVMNLPFHVLRLLLPTVKLLIADLDCVVEYDIRRGLRAVEGMPEADVTLASDSLLFCFKHDFGFDTLQVNGRFRKMTDQGLKKFYYNFILGPILNVGRKVDWRFVLFAISRKLFNRAR